MGILVGLAIAAVIGAIVAQDANKRGMNGAGWGFCTFLMCIVFLPLYLIMRKPIAASVAPPVFAPVPAGPTLCASCGKYYSGNPAFCPNCGASQTQRLGQ